MKNINEITKAEASEVKYILTDIDGTLTGPDGRISPKVYEMLWKLREAPKGIDLGVKPSAPSCPLTLPPYRGLQTGIQTAPWRSKQLLSQYDLRLLWFQ